MMNAIGLTHIGNVREVNEDTVFVHCAEAPYYALVADGMGGHAAGEIASSVAAASVEQYIGGLGTDTLDADQIVDAFQYANRQILERIAAIPAYTGMGTTLTFAAFRPEGVIVGHVGDSSAYLISGSEIRKISKDHTYLQRLIDSGVIRAEAAGDFPFKNIITRALGSDPLQTDVYFVSWKPGDRILLCSDGLTAYTDNAYLLQELRAGDGDLEMRARRLLEHALEAGGRDNISVVLVENRADGPS